MSSTTRERARALTLGALFSAAWSALACRTGFECEPGAEACACVLDDECNAGLSCEQGICVAGSSSTGADEGPDGSGSETGEAGESGSGEAETAAGDGDGDGDATDSGDGDSGDGDSGDGDSGDGDSGDGDSGDGDSGDGDSGDGDGAQSCDAGFTCQDPIPLGWNGPVVLGESLAASCPGNWPAAVHELGSEPDLGSLSCGCECGPANGVSCGSQVELEGRNTNCFNLFQGEVSVELGECYFRSNIGLSGDSIVLSSALSTNLSGASCSPQPSSSEVEPSFGGELKTCTSSFAACDGGYCEPEPTPEFGPVCIYISGDVACPAGRFSEKVLGFEGFEDDRSCSACTCGSPEGECFADLNFHNNSCQTPVLVKQGQTGGCTTGVGSAAYITMGNAETSDISCTPSPATVEGSVETNGATTLCCDAG